MIGSLPVEWHSKTHLMGQHQLFDNWIGAVKTMLYTSEMDHVQASLLGAKMV